MQNRAASPFTAYADLRAAVAASPIGDGGIDVCRALTSTLDDAVRTAAGDLPTGVAVVALGGYGRREQCIHSDIDVMVLHEGTEPEPVVRAVLYPMWDANLKVGHAVRNLSECGESAHEDFATLTSLLSARFVAGDRDLYGTLVDLLTDLVRGKPFAGRLVHAERLRRATDPYPVMAADVKEGRGGLRTHQGAWWERRRAELLGLPADEPTERETEAFSTLLRVRNALHAAAGRANDRFEIGLREPAADWLGDELYDVAAALVAALETGDRLADRRWPDLHVDPDPLRRFRRRILRPLAAVRNARAEAAAPPSDSSVFSTAVGATQRRQGAWFTIEEEAHIRSAAAPEWTEVDREAFVQLLAAGARGRTVLGRLDDLGWLVKALPEWGVVATAPQLAPFHDHPVGAHLLRTVDEMHRLIADESRFGEIAATVSAPHELYLAAFLHDIGKARGGNHAEVGAEVAAGILQRAGYAPSTIDNVVTAVQHHLLLSETATRRDIANPDVIDEIAHVVDTHHLLRILYLLTVADLRATGTTVWSEWRAALLDQLFVRASQALDDEGASPATPGIDAVVAAAEGRIERGVLVEHLERMPSAYMETTTAGDIVWHVGAVADLEGPSSVSHDPADGGRILVVGEDRTGFLLAVSRAFAANGVAVLDARLQTRDDGMAIDTFHVCEDMAGEPVGNDRLERVAADLNSALTGDVDLRPAIADRVRTYRKGRENGAVDVRARRDGRYAAVEIRMPDGVGVFAAMVEALDAEGLDIHLAKIDTRGDQARDVFHVRRIGGGAMRSGPELDALAQRIADRLKG